MPLRAYSSRTAWSKLHACSTWPPFGSERLFPIARPRLEPTFRIQPGERVFTIGSCFARNIEKHLHALGIIVAGYPPTSYRNQYNIFSVLNALTWALEETSPPPFRERFIDLGGDRCIDPYLCNEPLSLAECLHNAHENHELYKQVRISKTFIITLGLVEAWWDRKLSRYVNQIPNLPKYIRADPRLDEIHDRFEFHQLSHDQIHQGTMAVLDLIHRHAVPECRILLTVSPVPLWTTFTDHDVLVANAYSKALLRVVAEEAAARYPFVDYLPTFESITLGEAPAMIWESDASHVRSEAVEFNVSRMLAAYVNPGTGANPDPEGSGEPVDLILERWYYEHVARDVLYSNDLIADLLNRWAPARIAFYGTGARARDLVEQYRPVLLRHQVQFVTSEPDGNLDFHGFPKGLARDLHDPWPDWVILLSNLYEKDMLTQLEALPPDRILTLGRAAERALRSVSRLRG